MAQTRYTQEQLDALREAISLGAREVYYGQKRIVYRSLAEMRTIEAEMEIALGQRSRIVRVIAETNKNL